MISGRAWLLARLTWVVVAVVFVGLLGGFHPSDDTRDVVVVVAAVVVVSLNALAVVEGVRERVWVVLLGCVVRLAVVAWVLVFVHGISHERPNWDAKDAGRHCRVDALWPEEAEARCRALHMCANTAPVGQTGFVVLIAATPNCPEP